MAAIGPLLVIIGTMASAIGSIITLVATVGPVIAGVAAPILGVVAAIAAAIAIGVLLYKNWDTIKAKAKAIWGAIKNAIKAVIVTIVNEVRAKFMAVKNTVTSIFNGIKNVASRIWNGIKNAITKPIETAKSLVKSAINKIKGFFPLKIGKIFSGMKLPHFSIKGSPPFGIGGKGTKPSISVSWYKKAMQQPYLFSNATLFGAGERGDEMLYGRNALMKDIAQAVGGGGGDIIMNVYGSDNMSVNDLANAVEQKLIQAQKRRTQAWA